MATSLTVVSRPTKLALQLRSTWAMRSRSCEVGAMKSPTEC